MWPVWRTGYCSAAAPLSTSQTPSASRKGVRIRERKRGEKKRRGERRPREEEKRERERRVWSSQRPFV